MAPWHYDTMALWHPGIMTPWRYDTMASWCHGIMTPWLYDTMALWCQRFMTPWYYDTMSLCPFNSQLKLVSRTQCYLCEKTSAVSISRFIYTYHNLENKQEQQQQQLE